MKTTYPIHTHTLANGLRLIAAPSQSAAVYCGYVVRCGTRHEEAQESGMAHFIEHLTFKGTSHRKSWQIINGLERVGGDLNAYTTKQETVYHAAVLPRDFRRAAELLTDIVFCSTYPQTEIDKEVEVICDEIDSYRDSPSEIIFDEFESMLFKNHPLGRDILGEKDILRSYRTADAQAFAQRHYHPDNMVFFVVGNIPFARTIKLMEQLTTAARHFPAAAPQLTTPSPLLPPYEVEERKVNRQTHQAHVMMGNRAFGGCDPRRHAMVLLNNILGGPGMNSKLNLALREKAGLVYSVDSYLSTYPDTAYWSVYFGCDAHDIKRCCKLVRRELAHLTDHALTPRQLDAAKKQLLGQMGIADDNIESRALGIGKIYAHYNDIYQPQKIRENILSITPEELLEVAQSVYDDTQISTLIYA